MMQVSTDANDTATADKTSTPSSPPLTPTKKISVVSQASNVKQPVVPELQVTDDYGDAFSFQGNDNPYAEYLHMDNPDEPFREFTRISRKKLLAIEIEEKKKNEIRENLPQEGRLVDGELIFDDGEGADDELLEKDLALGEGNVMPDYLSEDFPLPLIGKPLEEIDPYTLHKEKTFVVITKRFKKKYIHRFSATRSLFIFAPWNPIRKAAILVATHQAFDYFIIFTILINCVFFIFDEDTMPWLKTAEYIFTAIYTMEMLLKMTARGFIINKYTYLRDAWNWLDLFVVSISYVSILLEETGLAGNNVGGLTVVRAFRVFRALKTVSIIPGLKTIISALFRSMRMLAEVVVLKMFCMMVFALFAVQVYVGTLRNKCVRDLPGSIPAWADSEYLKDPSNYFTIEGRNNPAVCGNATGAGKCPANYTCLPDVGDNPNWGYTNFDNFGWAMLNSFQLITLDFWEDLYAKVLRANGPWNVIFFFVVVFFGSFYLVNMMLAVVNMSYEEEVSNYNKEKEREKEKKKKKRKKEINEPDGTLPKEEENSAKTEDNKNSTTDTNHLQVMRAVNGSTASSTSLKSVGNGVLRNSRSNLAEDAQVLAEGLRTDDKPKDDAMNVETSTSQNPESPLKPRAQDTSKKKGAMGGSKASLNKDKDSQSVGRNSNDTDSVDSENMGDPPLVIVRARGLTWLDDSSQSEEDEDDDELVDRNCGCCSKCCTCFIPWLKYQNMLYKVVSDIVFEIFITFCILLNVTVMAIAHHNMSATLALTLDIANYIFTGIFILEAIVKMFALSKHYYKSGWNIFDFIIVLASILDLGVESIDGLAAFRAFRLLRLLRVFKLAQTWSTMRMLLSIIMRTLGALANLTLVLVIVSFIFAVIGMQLFSKTYTPEVFAPDRVPRWNFNDFGHSIVLIFRVLCGEWIEPLWDCMRANGEVCMAVFLPTLVVGNLMVLNLFLALLLNSFANDSLNRQKEKGDDKMKQGWQRLKGLFKSKKNTIEPEGDRKQSIADIVQALKRGREASNLSQESKHTEDNDKEDSSEDKDNRKDNKNGNISSEKKPNGSAKPKPRLAWNEMSVTSKESLGSLTLSETMDETFQTDRKKLNQFSNAINNSRSLDKIEKAEDTISENKDNENEKDKVNDKEKSLNSKPPVIAINDNVVDDGNETDTKLVDDVDDCFWEACYKLNCCKCYRATAMTPSCLRWRKVRLAIYKVTEHKAFEYFILIIILVSSICLCFEDIYLYQDKVLKETLSYLNIIFCVIFSVEMVLKWVAVGYKKYFSSFWTILDFCIVVVSVVDLVAESTGMAQISSFRALRTLRAFRPLRAISRWQGMRIVVNALMYAIPSIVNVLLVCLVFWLIFSIAGVQLFGGKFYKCLDSTTGTRLDATLVPNRTVCEQMQADGYPYNWTNSRIHFDDILNGYLALFQVATFEGWIEVMYDAVDAPTNIDEQPSWENQFANYIFFCIFIVWGSFFSLNLFIGVIIDNFNMLKKKYEGGYVDVLLTQSQRNYYNTMKKLGNKKPQKTIKRPKNKVQGFFFDVSMSTKFELAIVILILMNMIAMAVEHYRQSEGYSDALDIMNMIFTTIFTLEAVVKIIGMRWHYFRRAWNVFDFIIVALSIVGVVLDDILREVFVTPSLLRVVRVFRIGRVLRLIKVAKGIRKLLFALVISLPALFNIAMLLFLILVIYAIFGMAMFGHIKLTGAMDDVVNFQTFGKSMLLLFRLCTAGGWNEIFDPLTITQPHCDPNYFTMPDGSLKAINGGDCGNIAVAIIYMVSFVLITYLIIINMYIAVILENFSQAHEQEEVGITEDDFEMFYLVWERYDPHATQFIKYEQLSELVSDLDAPLGIPKPNEIALVAFDLPIYEGDRLHCLDVLVSLVKHVLGQVESSDEFTALKGQMEQKFREAFPTRVQQNVMSTTMRRKKEDVAAKTLQRCWRKHKATQNIRKITEMAMQAKHDRGLTKTSFSLGGAVSRRPSQVSSLTGHIAPSPRPASGSSHRGLKVAADARRKSKAAKTLKVPTANEIRLPSDTTDLGV